MATSAEASRLDPASSPRALFAGLLSDPWWYAAAMVMLLAAALRFAWIDFDLPHVPDIDAFKFVGEANQMVATGEFRPHDFQYPTGYTYLLAGSYAAGGLKSAYSQHLCARMWSAVFDLGTIVLAGLVALRLAGRPAALIATAWLACSTLHVTISRTAGPDAMLTFFMTAALWRLVRPNLRWTDALLAGAFVGLAVGTKFSGLYAAAWLPIAVALAMGKEAPALVRVRYVAIAVLACAAAFLITTPWFFPLASQYLDRVHYETQLQHYGQIGRVQLGHFDYLVSGTVTPEQPWLATSLGFELGPVAAIVLLLATLAALAMFGGARFAVMAVYAAVYVVLLSGPGRVKFLRFLAPITPVCAVLAGWFCQRYILGPLRRTSLAGTCVLMTVVVAFPAWRSCAYVASCRETSSVMEWRQWMISNVPSGADVFVSTFFLGDCYDLPLQITRLNEPGGRQYGLPEDVGPNPEREPLFSADLLQGLEALHIEYVVLNSYFEGGLAATPDNLRWFPKSVENYAAFRAALAQDGKLLKKFDGFGSGRGGPNIEVWRLRSQPQAPASP